MCVVRLSTFLVVLYREHQGGMTNSFFVVQHDCITAVILPCVCFEIERYLFILLSYF